MKFRLNNEEATFYMCRSIKQSGELQKIFSISYRVENVPEVQIEVRLSVEALEEVIMNFDSVGIEEYDAFVDTLERNKYRSKPKKLELDMKHRESPPAIPSIVEAPKLYLKDLLPHLKFLFLGINYSLLVIIAADVNGQQVECLMAVLKRFKRAIG